MKGKTQCTIFILLGVLFVICTVSFAGVIKKDGKIFISDRKGEEWDITQAVSIGFKPDKFDAEYPAAI